MDSPIICIVLDTKKGIGKDKTEIIRNLNTLQRYVPNYKMEIIVQSHAEYPSIPIPIPILIVKHTSRADVPISYSLIFHVL